ncbi:MAG: MoaD/ThiS family protein [Anaerolineales bacterium]|jgi:molybdopterin converting factor small subunit
MEIVKVSLKLIATYRQLLPSGVKGNIIEVEIPPGTQVGGLLGRFDVPLDAASVVLVNGVGVELDYELESGDVVSAFPAMAGG